MTKQTINRMALAAVLVIASISAWADRVKVDALTNGTITVGAVAENGEQTVTLTVTPANSYYIETSDIIVNKTQANAQAPQRRTPGYAEQLTVTAVSVDGTGKGTYQFTIPNDYGAYVQATFRACMPINPTVNITGWTYGATANKPSVTGNSGQGDVTYTYASRGSDIFSSDVPVNAGNYTVKAVIAAAGHYLSGEATADFTIAKAAGTISYATAAVNKTYGDEAFVHELTKTGDGAVTYVTNKPEVATVNETTGEVTIHAAGEATITATVTDGSNYSYAVTTTSYALNVTGKALQNDMIQAIASQTYTGSALQPAVTVKDGATTLVLDTDYTVAYSDNVNAGTATVQITGKGNYKGTATATFTITKAAGTISYATATVNKTYGDEAFVHELTKTGDGAVTYATNKPEVATVNETTGEVTIVGAGEATITATVTDGSNYSYAVTTASYTLNVTGKALQNDMIQAIASQTYTGSALQPAVTVKDGETTLVLDTDYTVAYSDNVNVGTATVTVTGKGNYKGTATATFTITKAAGTISYATATVSKTYGDEAFVHALTNTGDGEVTYATNKPEVATVNEATGEVTIHAVGEATITATVTDGSNYNYDTTTATYTLTVQQKTVGLAWGETTFDADDTEKMPAATATGLVGDDVCAVTVTGAQTAVGSYTATATALSNANYKLPEEVTCDFTIVRDMSNVFTDGCQWATYVAQENLAIPNGLTAYVVSSVTTVDVTANEVEYIPVGVGILLYRDAVTNSVYKGVAYTGELGGDLTSVLTGNATAASEVVTGSDYVFYNDEFVLADNTAAVGAGQAYLPAKDIAAGAASHLSINNTGIPTGINEVRVASSDDTWYTLDGLKLSGNPARRGLYIQNGKKIIVR